MSGAVAAVADRSRCHPRDRRRRSVWPSGDPDRFGIGEHDRPRVAVLARPGPHRTGLVGLGSAPDVKDIETAVLRHQLTVLRRQVARPRYTPQDRLVLGMLARLLSGERWAAFLVTPSTLLRWHRESGGPPLGLSAHRAGSTRPGSGARRSGGADGPGEPTMGIRQDRGGVPQARM